MHTLYWPTSCTPADPFLAGKTAFAYLRGGGGALTREGERRFLAKFILLACSWLRYSTSLFVQDFSPLFALYAWIIFGFRARAVSIFSLSLIVIVIASSRSWWKDNYEEEMFLSLSLSLCYIKKAKLTLSFFSFGFKQRSCSFFFSFFCYDSRVNYMV